MQVVLINGKKRVGKDFFANLLKEELISRGYKSKIMSFAQPIKEIICKTFGITLEELEYNKNHDVSLIWLNKSITYRELLQNFGTEAMQTVFSRHIWVNKLVHNSHETDNDFVLVPDFRFEQEAVSDITVQIINKSSETEDSHASENGLNNFKFKQVINNTGYPDLTQKVKDFADYILNDGTV